MVNCDINNKCYVFALNIFIKVSFITCTITAFNQYIFAFSEKITMNKLTKQTYRSLEGPEKRKDLFALKEQNQDLFNHSVE